MACMTVFVHEAAMTTTLLTHGICQEVCVSTPVAQHHQPGSLRMSWIVVTDENGERTLRSRWTWRKLNETDDTGERPMRSKA